MDSAGFPPVSLNAENACGFETFGPLDTPHYKVFVHGYADVPFHWHREMEILFVLRGQFRLVVDGQVCDMAESDVIIINSNVPHNSTSISPDALICGVHLDAAHFDRMGLPGFASRHYLCRTFLHTRSFMERVAPLKAFIARLILDQTRHPEETMVRYIVAHLLATFVYRAIPFEEAGEQTRQLRSDSRDRVRKILDTIGKKENPPLSEIARSERLTIAHLSRMFKRHIGLGYREYCQNLRLDNAAEELRTLDCTIATIMERNGFGNPAVFYNRFRERFGCSPANYKRGRRPAGPQSNLTDEDNVTAQRILSRYGSEVGAAADMAIGLYPSERKHQVLRALHSASSS